MFFIKFNIRKMHLVIFQLQLGVFSVHFFFSFSCLNSLKEKSGKQILHKVTFIKDLCTQEVVSLFIYSEYIEFHHFSQYFIHLRASSILPSAAV